MVMSAALSAGALLRLPSGAAARSIRMSVSNGGLLAND